MNGEGTRYSDSKAPSALPPLLREMQNSFAIEGIIISDDRMREYAADFADLEQKGVIRERILRAMARRSSRAA
jgi:hypothetical protein